MKLPFDIARCGGTTWSICGACRRREAGGEWQAYILPAVGAYGQCENYIAPERTTVSNNTKEQV